MKKWLLPTIIICLILGLWFFTRNNETTPQNNVIATTYPLWEFTKIIGGKDLKVELLVPTGSDPHHWEPTAEDFKKLAGAKAIICQGISFEPWVEKASNSNALIYQAVPDGKDPHFWLDPLAAKEQVAKIASTLSQVDPKHARGYQKRAEELSQRLEQLHHKYQTELQDTKLRTFITTHQAFDYLARRYNLKAIALKGLAAEGEPKPRDLMKITNLAKREGVHVIFKEPLENPRLAEIIAVEIEGETRTLHPIGSLTLEESQQGEDYFSLMEANLQELKKALGDKR